MRGLRKPPISINVTKIGCPAEGKQTGRAEIYSRASGPLDRIGAIRNSYIAGQIYIYIYDELGQKVGIFTAL